MKLSPQILPAFMDVAELSSEILTSPTLYEDIYAYEHMNGSVMNNYAWLIDYRASLSEFIDALGQADAESDNPPLNLYKFYAARNINFPAHTVRLMNEIRIEHDYVNDLASLLRAITSSREKYLQHAVYIQSGQVSSYELADLRREIVQQFIYLRMYLPVIIADSYAEADRIFQAMIHGKKAPQNVSVFGTKKSGKSTLINALLGDEYAPSSSELPTPCRITYTEMKTDGKIILTYEGSTYTFNDARNLKKYLTEEFRRANKTSSTLSEMKIIIPELTYPSKLRGMSITDTPGTNFAAASGHYDVTREALTESELAIFVMNYSTHLTNDEAELLHEVYTNRPDTLLIALNRTDEMYAAEVVKSYERAADYIASRLRGLGYDNFVIVPISALTGMYADQVRVKRGKLTRGLNDAAEGDNEDAATYLEDKVREMRRFHGMDMRTMREVTAMSRMKYLMHLIRHMY